MTRNHKAWQQGCPENNYINFYSDLYLKNWKWEVSPRASLQIRNHFFFFFFNSVRCITINWCLSSLFSLLGSLLCAAVSNAQNQAVKISLSSSSSAFLCFLFCHLVTSSYLQSFFSSSPSSTLMLKSVFNSTVVS